MDQTVGDLAQLVMRRLLFHLIALKGGQITMTPGEFDEGAGMCISVKVSDGNFLFTLMTEERKSELGSVQEV